MTEENSSSGERVLTAESRTERVVWKSLSYGFRGGIAPYQDGKVRVPRSGFGCVGLRVLVWGWLGDVCTRYRVYQGGCAWLSFPLTLRGRAGQI